MDVLSALRVVAALALIAWLPGYAWSRSLAHGLTIVERFVLSVALSVAMVTLALFMGNVLLDVRISGAHAVWYALALTAAAATPWLARRLHERVARVLT